MFPELNHDEACVPSFEVPDPLKTQEGLLVQDVETWKQVRRPELLQLFAGHVYGATPQRQISQTVEVLTEDEKALGGLATRRELAITFGSSAEPQIRVLLYIPNTAISSGKRAPLTLGLNFNGNHTVHEDPEILINPATQDKPRGSSSSRWPLQMIMQRGYAVATACYHDIDPDRDDFSDGVHPLFYAEGQSRPGPGEWGAIGAWSWGLSRILDALWSDPDLDNGHVLVHGHSRLGKTALWAGAQDERFGIVVSNNSGCGGAAFSRRCFGETVERINRVFPHWFCTRFKEYNENEHLLPVDQHQLIALMAPRPVYVASATEDLHADPQGEFLSAQEAEAVYRLFGHSGVGTLAMPAPDQPVGDFIGYHLRTGGHGITAWDWTQFLNFADRHWKRQSQ